MKSNNPQNTSLLWISYIVFVLSYTTPLICHLGSCDLPISYDVWAVYACTYVNIPSLSEARYHSHLKFKSTINSIMDNVEYCVVDVAAQGRSVPKDNIGKAICEERNALFGNMSVHRMVKRRRRGFRVIATTGFNYLNRETQRLMMGFGPESRRQYLRNFKRLIFKWSRRGNDSKRVLSLNVQNRARGQ